MTLPEAQNGCFDLIIPLTEPFSGAGTLDFSFLEPDGVSAF